MEARPWPARRLAEFLRPRGGPEVARLMPMVGDRRLEMDVVQTKPQVRRTDPPDARRTLLVARTSQVIDYVFYVVYTLLAIRLVLVFIGARQGSGFVQFIQSVTDPFYSVFRGIVASPEAAGFTLALPIVIAMVVYGLLQVAITRLLRLLVHRRTEI
jgi:uncharacterized protein YggT (Ycf19 family)